MKTPIIVFASGRGSNLKALIEACLTGRLDAEIRAVITDRAQAGAVEIAMKSAIPVEVVEWQSGAFQSHHFPDATIEDQRRAHDRRILEVINRYSPRFLVLAGYLRVMSSVLIEAFRSERGYSRIVNIHPSILPAFPGLNSYGQAFRYGVKVTGVTVHLVEERVDSGPICSQEVFSIEGCLSEQEVQSRGLSVEHELYAQTLRWVLPERFEVTRVEGRIHVRPD